MSIPVNTNVKRPAKEVVEGFRSLLEEYDEITPGVCDVMNRLYAMGQEIKPLFEGIRVVGVALTIKTIPGDISPVVKALDLIQRDDMLVVDTSNCKNTAFWGESVCMEAQRKGAVGIILDCPVRDVVELRKFKFPVLCQGVCPNAAVLGGFGYINVPIQCGGVVVSAGDIVIVDDDGVVVVPLDEAEDVLRKLRLFLVDEENEIKRIQSGVTIREIIGWDKWEEGIKDTVDESVAGASSGGIESLEAEIAKGESEQKKPKGYDDLLNSKG